MGTMVSELLPFRPKKAQDPSMKEYTLNDIEDPNIIQGILLN